MRKSTAAGRCGGRRGGVMRRWVELTASYKDRKELYGLFIQGESVLSATGRSAVYGLLHSREEASDPGQQKPGSLRIHKDRA